MKTVISTTGILTLLTAFVSFAINTAAQTPAEPEIGKGKIIEKIVIAADKSHSYALYLPSSYDPAKKFPVLFCFDPGGRGSVAVEKYRKAAEKYGYIVIASNNSRNGLDGPGLASIINNLWAEANRRFSIDTNRALAAGLSGGARVASWFAVACKGCIFGVIGSGAGFSADVVIDAKLPFIFFGTVGYDDFNYPEFCDLEKQLTAAHVVHTIEVFDGAHQWLDESLADDALAWFEIRAMKVGRRIRDDRLVDEFFQARGRRAEAFLTEKKYYEAYLSYVSIVEDFGEWRDVSTFAAKIRSLESSPELTRALKSDSDQIKAQEKAAAEIMTLNANLRDPEQRSDALTLIREKVASLRKKADAATDSPGRRIARRTLNQIFIEASESARFRNEREGDLTSALDNLELAGEANPKNSGVPYNRARIYALQGDKKKAVDALTKAVELGFKDAARIAGEKAFETLQKDERFVKLLAGLKQQ